MRRATIVRRAWLWGRKLSGDRGARLRVRVPAEPELSRRHHIAGEFTEVETGKGAELLSIGGQNSSQRWPKRREECPVMGAKLDRLASRDVQGKATRSRQ